MFARILNIVLKTTASFSLNYNKNFKRYGGIKQQLVVRGSFDIFDEIAHMELKAKTFKLSNYVISFQIKA